MELQHSPKQEHAYKYFFPIAIAFVALLMISNTVASKIIMIGPFVLAGGILTFPLDYIFDDILTEVYGYAASRKIIWSGLAAQVLMVAAYFIVQKLPAAPFWPNQAAYTAILGAVPRIVLGSIVGYFLGEFTNSYVVSKMKIWTKGKYLWTRTIGSTIAGEAVDTLFFGVIAFAGVFPTGALVSILLSGYVIKVAYEVVITPVTYWVVRRLKHAEGVDVYDHGVDYNPFIVEV